METLRLGTRGSELALFQARAVADLLNRHAAVGCEIVVIKTSGDRLAEAPLSEVGGKRLFVKEIEDALLGGEIDLAVHSSKDMPAVQPEGLAIGAVLERADPRDAVVLPGGRLQALCTSLDELKATMGPSPRIGTSSVRRAAQLKRLFPGATFAPIRGNLGTRLRKLDAGDYDAIVLAAAGLSRLEQAVRISAYLSTALCVPAPGQGIIAVEIRRDDERVLPLVHKIDAPGARVALTAERAVVMRLGGGCQMPIGAYADIDDGYIALTTIVTSLDGAQVVRADASGAFETAQRVGEQAADLLLQRGAGDILAEVERTSATIEGLQP